MDRQRMMATTKTQSYRWWFDSHNTNPARSEWLNSTLSALDGKTKAMLRIIEEDADSFSQRAEMYYKKRPQLVGMVEDFYRAHRSLAEQFDHLRHEPGSRRMNPLAHSFSHSIDPHKSYDSSFTKFAYDKEFLFTPLSNGSPEKSMDPVKPFAGRYTNLAYDSDESLDSEVEDPVDYDEAEDSEEEISSLERLSEKLMVKDQTIEELKLKLSESATIATQLMEEAERLRVENVEMARKFKEEKEELISEKQKDAREAMKKVEEKDEEKREAIRQLSSAIDMMKDENRMIKKTLVHEANKRWKPFESSQVLKGFGKLFNCSILSSQPSVVPL